MGEKSKKTLELVRAYSNWQSFTRWKRKKSQVILFATLFLYFIFFIYLAMLVITLLAVTFHR